MSEFLRNQIASFQKSQDERDSALFSFLRNVTTLSTGLLGLLVGLKPDVIDVCSAKYCFLLAIALLALGILSSVVGQFYQVHLSRKIREIRKKMLADALSSDSSANSLIEIAEKPMIYSLAEKTSYASIALSMILLVMYVFYMEFPNSSFTIFMCD